MSAVPAASAAAGEGVARLTVATHSPKRPALSGAGGPSNSSSLLSPAGPSNGGSGGPRFFDPSISLASLPPSVLAHYATHRSELEVFDAAIRKKAGSMGGKLQGIDVVVGIPFYTEITNIISVLVTLKEVFHRRRQSALLLVIGEFARSDMVEQIPLHQLEDDEEEAAQQGETPVHIESFWKPHPKWASKPFTVRALQLVADKANGGRGAHLIIMDADIQFNHWELSALSLMRALLDPLMALKSTDEQTEEEAAQQQQAQQQQQQQQQQGAEGGADANGRGRNRSGSSSFHPQFPLRDLDRPPAASFVLLNAPRSFIADDAIIHLFSYLLTYSYTGQSIHQSHGGEFSIHKQLNRALLQDESIVYRACYCVEAQMVCRALLEPTPDAASPVGDSHHYGGYVLEMLMKGKWHAKINLDKLLQLDATKSARLDLVTDKIFTDALLFAHLGLHTTVGRVHLRTGGLTKTPNPDPNAQSVRVLCPVATKKEMLRAVKAYYLHLLAAQADGSLPIDSPIVQELIPQLHSKLAKLPGDKGWNHVVSKLPAGAGPSEDHWMVFGADEWSRYTMELLRVFRDATHTSLPDDAARAKAAGGRRQAVVTANRVVWLLGALAFLNDHSEGSWGDMHDHMHTHYAPVFRRRFLVDLCGIDADEAERLAQHGAQAAPQQ